MFYQLKCHNSMHFLRILIIQRQNFFDLDKRLSHKTNLVIVTSRTGFASYQPKT